MSNHLIIKISKIFQAFTYWPIYLTLRFFVRFEIYGQENLKGLENGPIIFASNHSNYLDSPINAAIMPRYKGEFYPKRFFPIRFLAHSKFFKFRYLLVALYVWINASIKIQANTGKDLSITLREAIDALKNNNHIWIYPEGRISQNVRFKEGKRGIAYLHQQTGALIVPVFIRGTFGILSFKTLLRRKKVIAMIGAPIYSLENFSLEQATEKIMLSIVELSKKI